MVRKVTQAKFEEWSLVPGHVEGVLELIAGGLTLQKAAVKIGQPYMCLYGLFHNGGPWEKQYVQARKAWADARKDQAVEIAENVEPDRDHVAKAKLQIDLIDNQAKAYHRERWGERVQVDKTVNVTADAALVGTVGALLLKRRPRVLENVPGRVLDGVIESDSPSEALPAPAGGERG